MFWIIAYRDKKVVGVFVRFRAPLHSNRALWVMAETLLESMR